MESQVHQELQDLEVMLAKKEDLVFKDHLDHQELMVREELQDQQEPEDSK
jgi:hypothetical protein